MPLVRQSRYRLGSVLAVLVVALTALASCGSAAPASTRAKGLTVDRAQYGQALPNGFLGLSMELKDVPSYTGLNPKDVDPVFIQLVRDIDPGQTAILRFGGSSTDRTWWPVAHMKRPPAIDNVLTPKWMATMKALTKDLPAKLILGINFEADSRRIADTEAQQALDRIGKSGIKALELGNEPELYGAFGWYYVHGHAVFGRPRSYSIPDFIHDFASIASSMPGTLGGPNIGGPQWLKSLGRILAGEPRIKLTTVHAYPRKKCRASTTITNSELLAESSSYGFAQLVKGFVTASHHHGKPIRVDEMNGVSCGGQKGVSNAFSSALWVLDTLFELDRVGVNGVNLHTRPNSFQEILGPSESHGHWKMRVRPEFYGMLMFAQASPAGSRLLRFSGHTPAGIKLWATRAKNGVIHVVLIDKHQGGGGTIVPLRIPGAKGIATVENLRAPSIRATGRVTLGGQSFGSATSTGTLGGKAADRKLTPSKSGVYTVSLPAGSATMLTLASR
jgi:hypothetical protein